VGICSGYFTCYGTSRIEGSLSWRIPFAIQAVLAFQLALSGWLVPHSPRWLLLQGQREAALKELDKLNFSRAEAEKDMLAARQEANAMSQGGVWESFLMVFTRRYRGRTILALFMMGSVQLCGIDGVLFVS
jgi:hypothetical protein